MIKMKEGAAAKSGLCQIGLVVMLALGAMTAAQAQSLRIAKDPATGELRSLTAEENAALDAQAAAQKSAQLKRRVREAVAPIVHADGTEELKLDEESYMSSVLVRNSDGTMSMQCLPAKEAKAVVLGKKKIVAAKKGSQHE